MSWIKYKLRLENSSLWHQSFQLHELNANNSSLWNMYSGKTSSNLTDKNISENSQEAKNLHPTCTCYKDVNDEATTSAIQLDTHETFSPRYHGHDELSRKLASEGRTINNISGAGNCFFRSISKEITGSENCHKAIRIFIVQLISSNMEIFSQFVEGENVDDHVNIMCENGTWATECEIFAAATLLQRTIYILTPDLRKQKHDWLRAKYSNFIKGIPDNRKNCRQKLTGRRPCGRPKRRFIKNPRGFHFY